LIEDNGYPGLLGSFGKQAEAGIKYIVPGIEFRQQPLRSY